MCRALKRIGGIKSTSTARILGCTPKELMLIIGGMLKPGMTWENRGHVWHIDHVIPLSSAKTTDDIIRLWHYTNLQPLWAEDNIRKSNKMPRLQSALEAKMQEMAAQNPQAGAPQISQMPAA